MQHRTESEPESSPSGWEDGDVSLEVKGAYLARVLQSETLRSSPNLRRLLEFLGSRSLEGHGQELKEYIIGVEALDRTPDFDPKVDTIVRVQVHRLREKLSRYYEEEGREDHILITIPRGQYLVVFLTSGSRPETISQEALPAAPPSLVLPKEEHRKGWQYSAIALAIVTIVTGAFLLGRRSTRETYSPIERDPQVLKLWSAFMGDDKAPIIGYPDAVFLIDESNDLLRFRSGASSQRGSAVEPHLAEEFASNPNLVRQAGPLYYEDGYTGTGEIESVAALAAVFEDLGAHAQIKRSRDITIDDLHTHNVVLLGSSFQNQAVDELPLQGDFQFVKPTLRHELWDGEISNRAPTPGENTVYRTERDPNTHALRVDYALVSFQQGLRPDRHIAILAGLDTTGTAGATQFATSPDGASLILKSVSADHNNRKLGPVIQLVVRCTLKNGNSIFSVTPVATHTVEWREKQH